MIHYHGTPITPQTVAAKVLDGRHAFISFREPRDLDVAAEVCQSFAVDNGAFSAWRSGKPVVDWAPYYEWAAGAKLFPSCDFAIIPDVIDGGEQDNDRLLLAWPLGHFGVPVWHLHESLERLARLVAEWPRLALGSSGQYRRPGSSVWWERIAEAMKVVCDGRGRPTVRLHGLRMLAPEIVSRVPFASADSTNVARNAAGGRWHGTYAPPNQDWRALVLAARIEAVNAPQSWKEFDSQTSLFDLVGG
jgi:hypothetical protein